MVREMLSIGELLCNYPELLLLIAWSVVSKPNEFDLRLTESWMNRRCDRAISGNVTRSAVNWSKRVCTESSIARLSGSETHW